jgi:DHA1 family tetracycline resistance protein-like MFS transporter
MLIIFLIILVDLIGFGILIPLFPLYALKLGGGPALATALMAIYSGAMFLATPVLGRLSDRMGRRPVLMLSLAGATLGYLLLAFADSLWMIALSRLISGAMAGNLSTAQAYITDITSEENRAKGMGVIGAAFGLGFTIGPVLGSWMAGESFETANLFLPAVTSAGLSLTALLCVIFILPESHHPSPADSAKRHRTIRSEFSRLSTNQVLILLVGGGLVYNLGAGFVEAIFPIWGSFTGVLAGPRAMAPVLLAAGLVMVVIQGGLIGPLTRKYGEIALIRAGAVIFAVGMLTLIGAAQMVSYALVVVGICGQGAGSALILTSLQSLVSRQADKDDRGLVMGLFSGAGTFGRAVGTLLTGWAFGALHWQAPYTIGVVMMFVLLLISLRVTRASPGTGGDLPYKSN